VRFLLNRRWVLFAVAVGLLAYGCWWLGEWQFHRLDERRAHNTHISRNLDLPPAPVDDVLAIGQDVRPDDYWRPVRATGSYLTDRQVAVRYQTRDGRPGIDVVTPLRLRHSGKLLIVDRGWMPTANEADATPALPDPPSGIVTIVGWVRPDGTGDSTTVTSGSARAVSSDAIAATLGAPVYDGWVDLAAQRPRARQPLERAELPDLSEGPHFFYGLQWWFFAALAVFGFGYLAFDERRKRHRGRGAGGPPGVHGGGAPVRTEGPPGVHGGGAPVRGVTETEASRRPPAASRR
jgi:cytochrome oxidase assembly protein ShyY1